MKSKICDWLAKKLVTEGPLPSRERMNELLKNEMATSFLLVWPIFESALFHGYLQHNQKANGIQDAAGKYAEYYSTEEFDPIAIHFHRRYQNNRCYNNLRHGENDQAMNSIRKKKYELLSHEEKLYLITYVVYRYRNNIFHGNKGILSWSQYTEQIEYCIQFMMKMIDIKESVE